MVFSSLSRTSSPLRGASALLAALIAVCAFCAPAAGFAQDKALISANLGAATNSDIVEIAAGQTKQGTLSTSDDSYESEGDIYFFDPYVYFPAASGSVTLTGTSTSSAFTPFVYVFSTVDGDTFEFVKASEQTSGNTATVAFSASDQKAYVIFLEHYYPGVPANWPYTLSLTSGSSTTDGPDLDLNYDRSALSIVQKRGKYSLKGRLTVVNYGNKIAGKSVTSIYLLSDLSDDAQYWTMANMRVPALKPAKARAQQVNARFPSGVSLVGKYLLIILDSQDTVDETDEDNNYILLGPFGTSAQTAAQADLELTAE